jgi:RNA recognition motif-containing protein
MYNLKCYLEISLVLGINYPLTIINREMRSVKPKGIAFVEFDDELKATHCLNELNG